MDTEIVYLYLDDIIPNRFQPREIFDDQALKELAISIKEHGVIQPIIVRRVENKYEIIAGERRYKASTMAGLTKIPAIVKNLDDKESSKVALIENLQRRDLTPIEEARTYQKILELENGMTQDELAQTMGKTQSAVSNKLRLLSLPEEVQDALLKEQISERHARSLLNLSNKNDQIRMLDKIVTSRMTVRELDREIRSLMDNNSSNATAETGGAVLAQNNNDKTSTNDVYSATSSLFGISPTEVDINKIRQNSVDIIRPDDKKETDINELMKDPETLTSNDFKFVPSFVNENLDSNSNFNAENNFNSSQNSNNVNSFDSFSPVAPPSRPDDLVGLGSPTVEEDSNSLNDSKFMEQKYPDVINRFFSNTMDNAPDEINNSSNDNSNLPNNEPINNSNINTTALNDGRVLGNNDLFNSNFNNNMVNFGNIASSKKDVKGAVSQIINTVKNVENQGYNINVEELNLDNTYQVVIKISKD